MIIIEWITLVLLVSSASVSNASSPEEILKRNQRLANSVLSRFAGKRIEGEVFRTHQRESTTIEELDYRYDFHIATTRRWRLNVTYSDGFESVFVRNGSLHFTGIRRSDSHPFSYSAVGFDRAIVQDVTESALARSGILEGTTSVMGMAASEFLGDGTTEIRKVFSVDEMNSRVKWDWALSSGNAIGSIELLNSGMVSSFMNASEGSEVTIEYNEDFPIRMTTMKNSSVTGLNRAIWRRGPNQESSYYMPESIGLESPKSPWRSYGFVAMLVITTIVLVTWLIKRRWLFRNSSGSAL